MKENYLDTLTAITVESKTSLELKPGVWNGNTTTGTEYIPNNSPDSYKIYRRLKMGFLNARANLEYMFYLNGGVDAKKYTEMITEIERNMLELESHYKYEAVSLLVVNKNDANQVDVLLFDDQVLCNYFLQDTFGVTFEDVQVGRVPEHLRGTRIFKQNWHTSRDNFIKNNPSTTNLNPPKHGVDSI